MNSKTLHWSYRDFRCFPKSILAYRDILEEIYLKENFIVSIPLWVFEMKQLTFIHLAGNELKFVPQEIGFLINLEFFDVTENQLTELPFTIGLLKKLRSLHIGRNKINELPKSIGQLKSLQVLYAEKNSLREIPNELCACQNLTDISFDDNSMITEIPKKLFSLPKLKYVSVDRCNIYYLPFIKCITIKYLQICENYFLSHIPYYYENFITYDYTKRRGFCETEALIDGINGRIIRSQKDNRLLVIPGQLTMVYQEDCPREPLSLFELALSSAHIVLNNRVLDDGVLPPSIAQLLRNGPVGRCGGAFCNIYIFRECFILFVKRNKRDDSVIISHLFCSKDCMIKWLDEKTCFYTKINWSFCNSANLYE